MGGHQVTEEIQKQLSIGHEDAEKLKCGERIEGIDAHSLEEIIQKALSVIAAEIQRSLDFFTSSTYGELHHIYLSGGGARANGFTEILTKKINIPIEFTNPFQAIQYNENAFDSEYLKELSPLSAVGVGLALRSLGD
jgi:type IV pilus assembly protein PilM